MWDSLLHFFFLSMGHELKIACNLKQNKENPVIHYVSLIYNPMEYIFTFFPLIFK